MGRLRNSLLITIGGGLTLSLYGIGVWNGSAALTSGLLLGASAQTLADWYLWAATFGMFAGIGIRALVSLITGASGRLHAQTTFAPVVVSAMLLVGGLWTANPALLCVTAFCVGWSFACLTMFWMTRIYLSPTQAYRLFPPMLLCAAFFNACYAATPQDLLHLHLAGSLLVATACTLPLLIHGNDNARASGNNLAASLRTSYVPAFKNFGEVLFCVVALETIAPTMNYMGIMNTLEPSHQLAVVGAAMASAAAVLFFVLRSMKTSPYSVQTFKYITPVLVLALFPAPFAGYAYSLVLLFAGSCLHFVVVNTLFYMDAMAEVRKGSLVFEFFYAVAFFALMVVCVALDHAMPVVLRASSSTELLLVFGVFTCIYLLSMAFVFARRRRREAPTADAAELAERTPPESSGNPSEPRSAIEKDRLELVRTLHGLSEREAEVVALLMRGKNVPAIAEELMISQNTVRSHVKRIYRATGVHTRQELINHCEHIDENKKSPSQMS